MSKQTNGWFEIEDAGFIRQQAGRSPEEIVRELVQNAFDADDATRITVDLTYDPGARTVEVAVEDDGAGFNTLKEAFTVFLSGKYDDPTKRGRKGRGLKEAIAVAHSATVEAVGESALFITKGKRRTRRTPKNTRDRGTRVEMTVKRWLKRDINTVVKKLMTFQPPTGVEMVVNGVVIEPHVKVAAVPARLQTLVIEEEADKRVTRDTTVVLLEPRPGETPHVYEMGIPVCPTETPWHLDVQQRMPIPDHRTAVSPSWLKKLYSQVLSAHAERMGTAQLKDDWVAQAIAKADTEARQHFVNKVFGKNAVREVPGKKADNEYAKEIGQQVLRTSHLPKGLRGMLRNMLPSSTSAVESAQAEERKREIVVKELVETPEELAVCRLAAWIATQVVGYPVVARMDWEERDGVGHRAMATWCDGEITFSRTFNSKGFFSDPFAPEVLSVIVHEIAHAGQKSPGHPKAFYVRMQQVAGRVARLLLDRGDEARRVVAGG